MDYYGLMLIVSFSITALLTPFFSRIALQEHIVDNPGTHKTHQNAVPLLGGVAIFIGLVLSMFIFSHLNGKIVSIFVGALILVIVGMFDDIYNMKPLVKLAGQSLAAVVVVLNNVSYYSIFMDTFRRLNLPDEVALVMLICFVVLMINAINLIDGLDGLAVGTAAIIFSAMVGINLINDGSVNMIGLQIIGAGACIGFLMYNFNPASVYMGDTGSMLIGYLLASTYILSANGVFSTSFVMGSVFIFGYPALDTTFAIIRRLHNRTSIFQADKGHIHHVLIRMGYSVRGTVLRLYALNIFFAGLAVLLLCLNLSSWALLLFGVFLVVFMLWALYYLNSLSKGYGGLNAIEKVEDKPVE
jgi:UDP-GlcNAc:undecaprenyl-phosphate/decaprenyl-phosphate GlcNAc-1-phosphate transferase